jgi:hypothetical protein
MVTGQQPVVSPHGEVTHCQAVLCLHRLGFELRPDIPIGGDGQEAGDDVVVVLCFDYRLDEIHQGEVLCMYGIERAAKDEDGIRS